MAALRLLKLTRAVTPLMSRAITPSLLVTRSRTPIVSMPMVRCFSNIEERVKKIIVEQLGVDEAEIRPNASFSDDLGADSLDNVELIMALEEEFDTEIADDEAEIMTTVQAAFDFVRENTWLSAQPPKIARIILVCQLGYIPCFG